MIYLDHNATTPTRPEAVAALLPFLTQRAGNPSSVHGAGRSARAGLDEARRTVGTWLGVHDSRVVFTSGGTEANTLALAGMAEAAGFSGRIIVSAVEHPSVLRVAEALAARGMDLTLLPVDGMGRVDPAALEAALTADTVLVSVMHANNETGVVQPVAELAALCRINGVPFHTDAVQSAGKLPVTLAGLGAQLLTLSGHKFGGPKGVGALILDNGVAPRPQLLGGGQERGRRSGTENLPGIVGMARAAQLAGEQREALAAQWEGWRDALEARLLAALPELVVFGQGAERLPNTSTFGLAGLDGETLVMNLDLSGFCISSGSACGSGRTRASHVLRAMGVDPALGQSAVRVSLGWDTTGEEVERFATAFIRVAGRLLAMRP